MQYGYVLIFPFFVFFFPFALFFNRCGYLADARFQLLWGNARRLYRLWVLIVVLSLNIHSVINSESRRAQLQ